MELVHDHFDLRRVEVEPDGRADEAAEQPLDEVDPPRLHPTAPPRRHVSVPQRVDPGVSRDPEREAEPDAGCHGLAADRQGHAQSQPQADDAPPAVEQRVPVALEDPPVEPLAAVERLEDRLDQRERQRPEQQGDDHRSPFGRPPDARDRPQGAQAIEDRHERPAVDHPLFHAEERVARCRSPRRGCPVDRVHQQAGDEVDLAPESRLRKRRRRHRDDQPPPGAEARRPLAPAVSRDVRPGDRRGRDEQQGQMAPDRREPLPLGRQAEPVGDDLVEGEQDEHPAQEFLELRPIREGEPAQAPHHPGRRQQDQRADRIRRPDDQGRHDRPRMPARRRQAVGDDREIGTRRDARGGLAQLERLRPARRRLEDRHRAARGGEQADREGILEVLARGEDAAR